MKPFRRSTLEHALERALIQTRNVHEDRSEAALAAPTEDETSIQASPLTA
jgi:hypothetical protein